MGAVTAFAFAVRARVWRLLDRVSEHGIPQLSATSLALFGLYNAASFGFFADRYTGLASFSTVFTVAHPAVWAGLYALTSLILLYGSLRDRDFVKGATLGLCAVHALIGVMTIYPIVGPLEAPPTAFSAYATPAVWCYLTFLLWRIRVAKR
jgi:hypothetical protein